MGPGSQKRVQVVLFLALCMMVGNAWAMRPKDGTPVAKPGKVDVGQIRSAVQQAPARYSAWKAATAAPRGKARLQRPVQAALQVVPAGQAARVANLRAAMPDLEVRFDQATGAATFIKSRSLQTAGRRAALRVGDAAAAPADAGLSCLQEYRGLLRIDSAYSEFAPKRVVKDDLGLTHLRYQQTYKGLPVYGKEVWVHVDPQDNAYLVAGRVQPTPRIDVHPRSTAEQAIQKAWQQLGPFLEPRVELVIHVDRWQIARLAWHVTVKKGDERWHWLIDDRYGAILQRYNDTRHEATAGSGVDLFGDSRSFSVWHQDGNYYLVDTSLRTQGSDPLLPSSLGSGNLVVFDARNQDPDRQITGYFFSSLSPSDGWDAAGVTTMSNLRTITNYYKSTHNRGAIDGQSLNTIGFVHVGDNWENASWTGQVIFLGDGGVGPGRFLSLARSLDVLAHEYTHGVVDYTASFEYQFQPGALHEAFADIFGCMIDRDDWLMGEDIVSSGPPLRNLIDPSASMDPLPTTMDDYQNLPIDDDLGGVHVNATIVGHAAYLMAEGLAGAIGRDKVEKIFYRALTLHLTTQSNFADCRRATIQSAEELYGAGSAEVEAVTAGWDAVKVRDSGGGGGGTDIPPVEGPDSLVFLYYNNSTAYLGMRTSTGQEYQVSETPVSETRPVVTSGGTEVLFVDATNNLRVASLSLTDIYEEALTTSGAVRTIAGSRDGRFFAFTDTNLDNKLYLLDLQEESGDKTFDLYLPSVDGGQTTSLLSYADVIDFDITDKHIVFDAQSEFNLPATGESYTFWSVGVLDISTGQVQNLMPAQPPGIQVGNPATSSTRDWLLAVDVVDDNADRCETRAVNLISGSSGLLWEESPILHMGWASFNGDDTNVAVQSENKVIRVPVLLHQDGTVEGDRAGAQTISDAIYYPRYYRSAENAGSGRLTWSASVLDFAEVNVGETRTLTLTLGNDGSAVVRVTGLSLTDTEQFSHSATPADIQPGGRLAVNVTFAPAGEGRQSAVLTITSDDPMAPEVAVRLVGVGVVPSNPNNPGGDANRGGNAGPCLIATAAYGSWLDPHVATLRAFRDEHLLTSAAGRAFVRTYYRLSPPIAALIARHDNLRTATRWVLTPVVLAVQYPEPALVSVLMATGCGIAWYRRRRSARTGTFQKQKR